MDDDLLKTVESSGLLPHLNTIKVFRQNKWSTLVSPYYEDSLSNSIRETDLIAERQYNSSDGPYDSSVQMNLQLFVECKFIKQKIVLWFDRLDKEKAIQSAGEQLQLIMAHRKSGDFLPEELHHLQMEEVAKLFSTNNKEDVIYKALNQCLHSQIHYRKHKRPFIHNFNEHQEVSTHIVHYPLIVCENFSNFSKIEFEESGGFSFSPLKDHFLLEINYRDDYFLIDVVDINYLAVHLDSLDKEANKLMQAYSFKEFHLRSQ